MSTEADIYCVAAEWLVQPGHEETVGRLLREAAQAVRANEPGNLVYTAHQSTEEPGRFFIYEQYVNQAAQLAHRETADFKRIVLGQIVPLLAERKTTFYRLLL
ncbi:putative quinol monooxygenase [Hymenobacter chitinivorans]|uniref:Quinol monooxygenase YgiN n=1 Tax=Hymenobacter chitinivorans DSM 11115 TaxID=1121954 RepID=A0A2M9BNE5_9BACT|nr:antibiotic biosynthesis monooxygenase family protein [Hymenobacter chitinivorans]PJJ59464.1 quinol monooxygenase YgiN [Hymenobacter chitinivorans DSM 11115]